MSIDTDRIIKTVRINEDEARTLCDWLNANNPNLEAKGEPPLIASEVVHLLLAIALPRMRITEKGEAVFE